MADISVFYFFLCFFNYFVFVSIFYFQENLCNKFPVPIFLKYTCPVIKLTINILSYLFSLCVKINALHLIDRIFCLFSKGPGIAPRCSPNGSRKSSCPLKTGQRIFNTIFKYIGKQNSGTNSQIYVFMFYPQDFIVNNKSVKPII